MHRYKPITEKPYCCVPAVLQMVQARRGLAFGSQDDIGYELGLIVPAELVGQFSRVRTGPEPVSGYGTQTSLPEFSIERYFERSGLPLTIRRIRPGSLTELKLLLTRISHKVDEDIILCFNSQELFGDGDIEHVSLVEEYSEATGEVTVIDPAIGMPKRRAVVIERLFQVLSQHNIANAGELWTISGSSQGATSTQPPVPRIPL